MKRATKELPKKKDKYFRLSGRKFELAVEEFQEVTKGYKKGDEKLTRKSLRRYGIRQNTAKNNTEDSRRRRYTIRNRREGDKA